jgi:hypothetical protein
MNSTVTFAASCVSRSWTVRATRTTFWLCLVRRNCRGTWSTCVQEVYRLLGAGINDKHIEVIVRQMMRWVKVA